MACGVLLIVLGAALAVGRWPLLLDPCHTWDDQRTNGSVSADDPCASSSSTTQTRGRFILDSLGAEGLMMAGGAASVWGGRRGHAVVVAAAGGAMVLPTAILFLGVSFLFVVPAAVGLLLLGLAVPLRRKRLASSGPSHGPLRPWLGATVAFWVVAVLFFVQPFTGSFLLWAGLALAPAAVAFALLRGRPPSP